MSMVLDLAKRVFQVHGVDAEGGVVIPRQLRRSRMSSFFKALRPGLIGMEAFASARHWCRELAAMGREVRLVPPVYVKAYVKRGKTDAADADADAEAIAEAATRPTMRFVAVSSEERQAALMLHETRDLLIRQRTLLINVLRGHLYAFGGGEGRRRREESGRRGLGRNGGACRPRSRVPAGVGRSAHDARGGDRGAGETDPRLASRQ